MFVIDTDVLSELRKVRKGLADPHVAAWIEGTNATDHFISVISIHEIELGVRLKERSDKDQGAVLRRWLEGRVLPAFEGRILDVDSAVARRAAALHVPHPSPIRDAFIAASALVHGFGVVTRNVRDFEPMGVPVLNPWAPPKP